MSAIADSYSAFEGHKLLARGELADAVRALLDSLKRGAEGRLALYKDSSGRPIDLDLRGELASVLERLENHPLVGKAARQATEPRRRGRPRLGVVAREVTLLPRHWEWLAAQPGGASVTLRKLVEQARRADAGETQKRERRDAIHAFLWDIAADLPGFEEATRLLYRDDREGFFAHIAHWPEDIREQVRYLWERPVS